MKKSGIIEFLLCMALFFIEVFYKVCSCVYNFYVNKAEKALPYFKNIIIGDLNDKALKETEPLIKVLIAILYIALSFIIIVFLADFFYPPIKNNAIDLGPFGDFFGGMLNPIFTFLTFFGVVITIVMQRVELKLTREEYSNTNKEIKRQTLENQLFNLIDLHNKICENLIFVPKDDLKSSNLTSNTSMSLHKFQGRQVFSGLYQVLTYKTIKGENIKNNYQIIQNHHNYIVGHYFRNLFQVLSFIDGLDRSISDEQKYKYSKIFRAQFSTMELAILLLNCSSSVVDSGNFRNLLIKYRFLEHLGLYKFNQDSIPDKGLNYPYQVVKINGMTDDFITIDTLKEFLGEDADLGAFGKSPSVKKIVDALKDDGIKI